MQLKHQVSKRGNRLFSSIIYWFLSAVHKLIKLISLAHKLDLLILLFEGWSCWTFLFHGSWGLAFDTRAVGQNAYPNPFRWYCDPCPPQAIWDIDYIYDGFPHMYPPSESCSFPWPCATPSAGSNMKGLGVLPWSHSLVLVFVFRILKNDGGFFYAHTKHYQPYSHRQVSQVSPIVILPGLLRLSIPSEARWVTVQPQLVAFLNTGLPTVGGPARRALAASADGADA